MKKFKFRFEKVLAFRKHQEKQKQRSLAEIRQVEEIQKEKIKAIMNSRNEAQKKEKEHLTGRVDPIRLASFSRYFITLKKNELYGKEVLKEIRKEVEKRREVLVAATRQRKIYEKLKDRHREKYIKETNLLQQKETDDIGQIMHIRK